MHCKYGRWQAASVAPGCLTYQDVASDPSLQVHEQDQGGCDSFWVFSPKHHLTRPCLVDLPKECLTKAESSFPCVGNSFGEENKGNLLEEVYIAAADTQRPDLHTDMTRGYRFWQCMVFITHVVDAMQHGGGVTKGRSLNCCKLQGRVMPGPAQAI